MSDLERILDVYLKQSRLSRRKAVSLTVGGVAVVAVAVGGYTLLMPQQPPTQEDSSTPTPTPPAEKKKIIIAVQGDLTSFSPLSISMIQDNGMAIHSIFATPFTVSADASGKGVVSPHAALSFDPIGGDFSKMRLVLRKGITFHNGDEFNADAYVHSVDLWNKAPSTQARFKLVTDINVVDSHTIDVTYRANSITNQLQMSTNYFFQFMHPKQEHDQINADPIGLGPFKKKSFNPGVNLTIERVKDWWGDKIPESDKGPFLKSRGTIDEATFVTIKESSAAVTALRTGDIDVIAALSLTAVGEVKQMSNARAVSSGPGGWFHFHMNSLIKPLDDVRVRKAINFATDRSGLLQIYGELALPVTTLIPEGKLGYDPSIKNYPFDQARAKELLGEAGLKDGFDTNLVGIRTALDPGRVDATIAFSGMLKEVGINAPPDVEEIPIWIRSVLKPDQTRIALFPFKRTFSFKSPDEAITLFEQTVMPPPEGQLAVKDYGEIPILIRKVSSTADPTERDKLYKEIQRQVMDQATDVFYAFSVGSKGVGNSFDFPQWPAEHFVYPYTVTKR